MATGENEYKEIFLAESLEEYDTLSGLVVELEKAPEDSRVVAEIFRLLHNLKANSKAIGFLQLSELAHRLENLISLVRSKELRFHRSVVTLLLNGVDTLGLFIQELEQEEELVDQEQLQNLLKELDEVVTKKDETVISGRQYFTQSQNIAISELVHLPIKKLDQLLNLVGELMIDRERVLTLSNEVDNEPLQNVADHLYRVTNEIQRSVMEARLVNVGFLLNKFPRIVRDMAVIEGKEIDLVLDGQDIKIDRNILQVITDSLLHLVRNAIVHGIEDNERRKKAGKPERGNLTIRAADAKDSVLFQVKDDGRGIDIEKVRKHALKSKALSAEDVEGMKTSELLNLIFEPGFSLSKSLTEYSGRGVGLDVVKNAVDSLGGRMTVESEKGKGTTFNLYLPISIAVKGALLIKIYGTSYAIPLIHIDAVIIKEKKKLHRMGHALVTEYKGETISVFPTSELFAVDGMDNEDDPLEKDKELVDVVVVKYNNRKIGLVVDSFLQQLDIVVKPLSRPVNHINLFSGVTLLGNGEVCLVLDVPAMVKELMLKKVTGHANGESS